MKKIIQITIMPLESGQFQLYGLSSVGRIYRMEQQLDTKEFFWNSIDIKERKPAKRKKANIKLVNKKKKK